MPSICFVSHNAYGSIMEREVGFIGGAERQVSLLARWLASRGYVVSMLTWDEGQPDGIEVDGVRVFKICRQDEGIWGVRFLHPKWTRLIRAMHKADADIYFHACAECVTGQVAMWCRQNHRRFIYLNVSNADCTASLPELPTFRERVLYRYGLRKADMVIAQTQNQKAMFKDEFGRESVVIPMPCPGPCENEYSERSLDSENPHRVLWVGRVCKVKRPDLLLELARVCSDLQFDMVGPIGEGEYETKIVDDAQSIKNVTIHGRVTDDCLRDYYRKSSIFCSTSDIEGFPNTFLEAWSYGLPIVSTFDPDDLIANRDMGILAIDVEGLVSGIRTLLGDRQRWQQASKAARRYYLENHTIDAVMPRFENVFKEIMNTTQSVRLKKRKGS